MLMHILFLVLANSGAATAHEPEWHSHLDAARRAFTWNAEFRLDAVTAERELRDALALASQGRATQAQVGCLHARLGKVLKNRGSLLEARSELHEALKLQEEALGPDAIELADTYGILSSLEETLAIDLAGGSAAHADRSASKALLAESIRLREKNLGPDDPSLAEPLVVFALGLEDDGKVAEAEALEKRAVGILERAYGANSSRLGGPLSMLRDLYKKLGRKEEAAAIDARIDHLDLEEHDTAPDSPSKSVLEDCP